MTNSDGTPWPTEERFEQAVRTIEPFLRAHDELSPEAVARAQVHALIEKGLIPFKEEWGTLRKNDSPDLLPVIGSKRDVAERVEELGAKGVYPVRRFVTEWQRPAHWNARFQRARRGL